MRDILQFTFVCAVLILIVSGPSAHAQPTFSTVESIDWMAADSQLVVSGTVADVEYEPVDDTERYVWATVQINVEETLKGEHAETVTFLVRRWSQDRELDAIRQQRQKVLVFLFDREHQQQLKRDSSRGYTPLPPQCEWTPRLFQTGTPAIFELVDKSRSGLITMDLRVLTDPNEITAHVREAIEATPTPSSPANSHRIELYIRPGPRWSRPKAKLPAMNISLVVPADARLEKLAHGWIESEVPYLRRAAARALALFPSRENESLLRGMLDDLFFVSDTRQDLIWTDWAKREATTRSVLLSHEFVVRQAAWESLQQMQQELRRAADRP